MTTSFTHGHYREMLRVGIRVGYGFAGFTDLPALRAASQKTCLMRHDCDNDLVAAARIAEIEAEEGVKTTFFLMLRSAMYNVLAPTNAACVRQIIGCGHWLGLHFDASAYPSESSEQLALLVDHERKILAEEFGTAVAAVSFHQPDARILENRIKLNCMNTYDRDDMLEVYYASDSNLMFRGGAPTVLFNSGKYMIIQILTHPEWWTEDDISLDHKWERMLAHNFELMQVSLLRREDTYRWARRISFKVAVDESQ